MALIILMITLVLGAAYVACILYGLERGKTWAREITMTIALMEPTRGYMDYSYLREREKAHQKQRNLSQASNGSFADDEVTPEPPDQLAA